ncbi:glutamate racemase [Desulfatirhabdium butyrativorans]|uniref:glutamate racemase n=1 Tax=Desulfatirhabdium butyrativorans TaxID=340467 RepID=UPI0003FCE462|nr:aspartate/glutamate racemase family protein [Desulfatirhabdium butyrativorans]
MIGIVGSGIDALVVAKALLARGAKGAVTCCIDNLRVPLYEKTPQELTNVREQAAQILIDRGADCLVVASHRLSGLDAGDFRQRLKARGIECFDIFSATAAACMRGPAARRFGVMAPPATVEANAYGAFLAGHVPSAVVIERSAPLWISFIQEGIADRPEIRRNIKQTLRPLLVRQIDTLVLGCAAYSVLSPFLKQKAGKNVRIIDSATELVQAVIGAGFCEKADAGASAERQSLNILATRIDTGFEHACGKLLKGLPGYPPAKRLSIELLPLNAALSEI